MKIALISTDLYIYSHGVRAISSYLKKNGHETIIISMPLPQIKCEDGDIRPNFKKNYSTQAVKAMIDLAKESDVIGISSMASTSFRAIQLINALSFLKKPIIWGGIFPTIFPQYCIKHCDIICVGEGELALLEFANKIKTNQSYYDVKNFWFKKSNGEIIKNSVRNYIEINDISLPDFDLNSNFILEKNRKITKLSQRHIGQWLYYHSIRGCAFACTYCSNCEIQRIYQGKGERIRKKDIELTISDLKILIERFPQVKYIWFTDDDINLRTVKELEQFALSYKEKINLPFRTYMSPVTVNEEKLKILIDAGLIQIEMGVQTGSDRLNQEIYGRNILNKDVLRAAKLINQYQGKMWPPAYQIIMANPYEGQQDILDTIDLLRQIPVPHHTHAFGLVFFPGTPLYRKAIKDSYIKNFQDSAYNIDYKDLSSHFKIKKQNLYLNSILSLIPNNSTKFRQGFIPKFLFKYLLDKRVINFFNQYKAFALFFSHITTTVLKIRSILDRFYKQSRIIVDIQKAKFYAMIPREIKEPVKKTFNLN